MVEDRIIRRSSRRFSGLERSSQEGEVISRQSGWRPAELCVREGLQCAWGSGGKIWGKSTCCSGLACASVPTFGYSLCLTPGGPIPGLTTERPRPSPPPGKICQKSCQKPTGPDIMTLFLK